MSPETPHAEYPKPEDLQTTEHYWDTFGNSETEVSARWIVRFCQARGKGWEPFTYDEINDFYQRERKNTNDRFTFNQLVEGTHNHVSARSTPPEGKVCIRTLPGFGYIHVCENDVMIVKDKVDGKYVVTNKFLARLEKQRKPAPAAEASPV